MGGVGLDLSSVFGNPDTRNRLIRAMMGSDPSGQMDPAPAHRIEDDLPGTTTGLENQARQNRAGRLAAQLSQQTVAQPSNLDRLQSQYDALQSPQQKPLSLARKIGLGLITAAGGGAGVAQGLQRRQQQQQFEEGRYDRNRQTLLQQIEAERRMQEQEQLEGERDISAFERQQATQRAADLRQPPATMDTAQGPLQFDRNTRQWSPITIGGQPVGPKAQPKPDSEFQQFADSPQERSKPFPQIVADYAAASQKPERPGAESGTWQMVEDENGKPVMFNSKTGQTKAAPTGIQAKGTFAKTKQGAQDAQGFADMYMKSGKWSGPSDEAMLEKYFELAKPSSGFRMTQNQMDMLLGARSWIEGMKARGEHAAMGGYFSGEQRQQIYDTMSMLSTQKMGGPQGSLKDQVQNVAPEGTRVSNGQQILVKRNGKWVPE